MIVEPERTVFSDKSVVEMWSVRQVAAFFDVPVGTIYSWRNRGSGPPSYKVVGLLRYDRAEVLEWLQSQHDKAADL